MSSTGYILFTLCVVCTASVIPQYRDFDDERSESDGWTTPPTARPQANTFPQTTHPGTITISVPISVAVGTDIEDGQTVYHSQSATEYDNKPIGRMLEMDQMKSWMANDMFTACLRSLNEERLTEVVNSVGEAINIEFSESSQTLNEIYKRVGQRILETVFKACLKPMEEENK
ncbi:uncharacterized protein LOC128993560 [Macrosteles quadrilineatus]|uniref:uncharacterized protein LOC128993560 n=1 Tax=Macrosteles quadrilineatus TaxID=74068 RepID=UPI0023E1107B|nr:uncharacterized protein LOC128993560 [Macrosteles quadrilineatus]